MEAKTYVLVHGAWHGAWCWREVAGALRAMGHQVTTPTQTGVGERKHLLGKDITLDTFVDDIVNHIEAEEFTDVILVGHSFAGISITGTADKIPYRIRHLVYLDGVIIESGQSAYSTNAARHRRCPAKIGRGGRPRCFPAGAAAEGFRHTGKAPACRLGEAQADAASRRHL